MRWFEMFFCGFVVYNLIYIIYMWFDMERSWKELKRMNEVLNNKAETELKMKKQIYQEFEKDLKNEIVKISLDTTRDLGRLLQIKGDINAQN